MQNNDDIEREVLESYLRTQYEGIFSEKAIQEHIHDYVEFGFASQMVDWVFQASSETTKLLDIGCGFGSFVLLCRKKGIDAIGIEIEKFEVQYARKRLKQERPEDIPDYVYRKGNALHLPFTAEQFDIVTLWNVLEHIQDYRRLLSEVHGVLRPGGGAYIICPNYVAFRREAHYHIPWIPMLPKNLAGWYLTLYKKNPTFFKDHVFYTTNWGVLRILYQCGFRLHLPEKDVYTNKIGKKFSSPQTIVDKDIRCFVSVLKKYHLSGIVGGFLQLMNSLRMYANIYNPFKNSIVLHVKKKENL